MHDEVQFSLQARALANTGRDLAGRRFPVFFTEPEFPAGRDPALIYVTAAALRVLPFSDRTVRLPTAIVGVLNVVLMFAAGWLLFGSPWSGLLAASLLAATPIHFIRARLVLSPFLSIPFILGWLIGVGLYLRAGSRRALLSSVACITMSVYTYLACTVMAPVYLVMTAYIAMRRERKSILWPIVAVVVLVPAEPLSSPPPLLRVQARADWGRSEHARSRSNSALGSSPAFRGSENSVCKSPPERSRKSQSMPNTAVTSSVPLARAPRPNAASRRVAARAADKCRRRYRRMRATVVGSGCRTASCPPQ
jgi:hypothetical protein